MSYRKHRKLTSANLTVSYEDYILPHQSVRGQGSITSHFLTSKSDDTAKRNPWRVGIDRSRSFILLGFLYSYTVAKLPKEHHFMEACLKQLGNLHKDLL